MPIKDNPQEEANLMKEVELLRSIKHYNITKLIDHFIVNGYLCIVMEYARCGTLRKLI